MKMKKVGHPLNNDPLIVCRTCAYCYNIQEEDIESPLRFKRFDLLDGPGYSRMINQCRVRESRMLNQYRAKEEFTFWTYAKWCCSLHKYSFEGKVFEAVYKRGIPPKG